MEALTYELLFPSCHCSNKASSQVPPLRPTLPFPNSISGDEEGGRGRGKERGNGYRGGESIANKVSLNAKKSVEKRWNEVGTFFFSLCSN